MDIKKIIENSSTGKNAVIEQVSLQGHIYNDLFKITAGSQIYSAKVRNINSWNIKESLYCLSSIDNKDKFIHPYTEIIEAGDNVILISEWLKGSQPITENRDKIKLFFKSLAEFNKKNKSDAPYTSMYLDGKTFLNIEEMIKTEASQYFQFYKGKHSLKKLKTCLLGLSAGFGTVIMEDFNTGNMFIKEDGSLCLIDTEYLIRGLNTYQFEHINLFKLETPVWSNITEEAAESLKVYFDALNISGSNAEIQIRGYYLMSEFRKMAYSAYKKETVDFNVIDNNIDLIINGNIYENHSNKD
ncbi:hypothetical protein [Treponema pedis]|uniref:hypothetical protein n=1 Tax=Treponema pedis TaxID=409322 RepID=UPI00041A4973|nr:hypothetical protein [Treponema pedis]QSI03873.1 hypothetical protein DYQ05_02515 [Treponema pedis]